MPDSSEKSANSLPLTLEPSRWLNRGLIAIHALAWLCAVAAHVSVFVKPPLVLAVAWSFRRVRRDFLRDPLVRGLRLHPGGTVEVQHRDGGIVARVAGGVSTRWLVILYLDAEAGRLAVPVMRDGVEAEGFRRLRVGLRCRRWLPGKAAGGDGGQAR